MNVERNLLLGTVAVALIVALLGVIFAGENGRMARETEAQQGELIARGARLYDDYCAGCHGQRGEGGMAGLAPPLNVENLWADREDIAFYGTLHDYIALNIEAGHPSQRMPSWADQYGGPLRNDQVEDLTQFILNWQGQQPEGVRVAGVTPRPTVAATPAGTPMPVTAGDPDRGEQIFVTNCSSCHGPDARGTDLGPSLVADGVAAQDDDALRETISSGVAGTAMIPWAGVLSPQDIEDVIAHLRALTGAPPPSPPTPVEGETPAATPVGSPTPTEAGSTPDPTPTPPETASTGDAAIGRALFSGEVHLQRGGPPCLACHSAAGADVPGGGTLGPDLTLAVGKYGDAGLKAVMTNLNFPTMNPIYQDRPLTPQEQAHLTAFLQSASTQQPVRPKKQVGPLAIGGALVLMALVAVVWRGRLFGVRRFLGDG